MNEAELDVLGDCSADRFDKLEAAMNLLVPMEWGDWATISRVKDEAKARFIVKNRDEEKVATFCFESFPGCWWIVCSTESYVEMKFRGRGIGTRLNSLRVKAASLVGFKRMLATVRDDNEPQIGVLLRNDWRRTTTFFGDAPKDKMSLWERVL